MTLSPAGAAPTPPPVAAPAVSRARKADWLTGATTILRLQDALYGSDNLIRWGAEIAAKTAIDARDAGADRDAAIALGLAATNEARDRGSAVHRGIEALIRDEDHIPDDSTHPYWYGWSRFLIRERPEIIRTEQMLINESVGYGGTLDLVARLKDGRLSQIDIKTGTVKDSHRLQLAAYSDAEWWGAAGGIERNRWHQYRRVGPVEQPLALEAHYVLALSPAGYELIEMDVDEAAREHFRYLAGVHARLKAWKNGAGK